MRHLTASQKIAQLEHRIARLEREAGRFDDFATAVVEDVASEIAPMINARLNTKSSSITKKTRGNSASASFSLIGSDGWAFAKVIVSKSRNRLVAFLKDSRNKVVKLGDVEYFAMDNYASIAELKEQVRRSLKDGSIDKFLPLDAYVQPEESPLRRRMRLR